jgi:hypothetical protein
MNRKQIIILVGALIISALILWHDLPIEFPWIIYKVFMLFVKLFVVLALTIFCVCFRGQEEKASMNEWAKMS